MKIKLLKIYRFILLYGFERTIAKTASRSGNNIFKFLLLKNYSFQKERSISLIGCGQFGFATISYLLLRNQGKRFLDCYDLDEKRMELTAKFYNYNSQKNVNDLLANPKCKLIYIASNHFTHTDYSIRALNEGKDVYIEKPISVTWEQFYQLNKAVEQTKNNVYVGYNRPYSKSIRKIVSMITNNQSPLSLNCFISGHVIEANHWYRIASEGTRICGNVGHWIDLMVHLMNQRGRIPDNFEVSISKANHLEIDDNIVIAIKTDFNDIVSILITARTEPFEGINETINIQCGDLIAKIDDFKRLTIWKNHYKFSKKYWYKDVGHQRAINQPFLTKSEVRSWEEVKISTQLMLEITDMVRNNETIKNINLGKLNL
jgi:predicted dehydrogenase